MTRRSVTPDGTAAVHRVVVIGSGFGGMFATRALAGAPVQVSLIDRTSHHLFQPLLYQVATGVLSQGEIAPSTREVLRRQDNAEVLLGEVTGIDLSCRTVTSRALGTSTVTPYDSLIVAAGAGHSYFGNDHFEQFAPGLKSVDDALELRARIFGAFEMAELTTDDDERRACLTFVVVGGGPTGVEMAGQLVDLSRKSLKRNYRHFDPADASVILIEAGEGVLSTFGRRLSHRTRRSLARLGVQVRLNARVVDVDADGVVYEDSSGARHRVASKTKVWAAGVSASPLGGLLAAATGAITSRSGQLTVLSDCTLPGHPEVYVVGDLMQAGIPGVAQVAIQSGQFAAAQIAAQLEGREREPAFRYRDKGSLATISRFRAIASIGPLRLSGFIAWLIWLAVHLVNLVCFKNRVFVLLHWAVTFVGNGRSERTATMRQANWVSPTNQLDTLEKGPGCDRQTGVSPSAEQPPVVPAGKTS
jgi:NADH:ubiquinone reductase (H+-translocating)